MFFQNIKHELANAMPLLAAYILKTQKRGPKFSRHGNLWRIQDGTGEIYVPYIRRYSMYLNTIEKRIGYMLERYKIENLEGALVLDIGAHVGEFTLAAAPTAAKVVSFEPDPTVREALIQNTKGMNNVEILSIALSNKTGKSKFYVATEHADSSLFSPEKYSEIIDVDSFRLDDLNIDVSNYTKVILKMDAEGFEPEIIDGGLDWIRKNLHIAAVDVAPERAGSDTHKEVKQKLESIGFHQVGLNQEQVLIMERIE